MLLVWLCSVAMGGGYYYSSPGIVAAGRGGAWIAGADTQFAQAYNPAGLIRIDAPTINIGMSEVQQHVQFKQLRDDGTFAKPTVQEESPFEVPQLGFATPLGDDFAFAFGFFSPFAPAAKYDKNGPARYTIIDGFVFQFSIGPSLAWRPIPQLTFGMGLQWNLLGVGQELDVTITGEDDQTGDIGVAASVTDLFQPGVNFGLLIDPVEQLTIGLSVQPPTRYTARGSMELDFGGTFIEDGLTKTKYRDEDATLGLDLPWALRGGVAVRPVPKLEIEFATVYEAWSALEDIVIEEVDIEIDVVEDGVWAALIPEEDRKVDRRFTLPAGLSDTWSFRLGSELRVSDVVELRTGGFYETGSLAPKNISVALYDPSKWQWGAGTSLYTLKQRLRFDLALAGIFFPDLEVRNSTVTQIDAGVIPGITPNTVGNGDYSAFGWIVGAQASWAFRKQESDG